MFSDFAYTANSGNAPDASAITVSPIPPDGLDAGGNPGIRFNLAGFDAPGGPATDFLISYTVSAFDAAGHLVPVITDVHLTSNLALAGTGTGGFGNIVETIFAPPAVPPVGQISNSVTSSSSVLGDVAILPTPVSTLRVTKDVLLSSATDSIVTLSFIDQSFSQTSVPEPSVMVLAALGGVFAAGASWRKRRKAIVNP